MGAFSDNAAAIAHLAALPTGAVIRWNTHHLPADMPFAIGWVDVYCDLLRKAVGWNWAWTVEQPVGCSDDQFTLQVPYDAQLEMLPAADPSGGFALGIPRQVRLRAASGQALSLNDLVDDSRWERERHDWDDDRDSWDRDRSEFWRQFQHTESIQLDGESYPPIAHTKTVDGRLWLICPVWTPDGISRALRKWAAEHVRRDDLRFAWDPQEPVSPFIQQARRLMREHAAGTLPTVQLAEGVAAVDSAFDWLLSLPSDEAAQITSSLRAEQRRVARDRHQRLQAWLDTLTDEGRAAYRAGDLDPPDLT